MLSWNAEKNLKRDGSARNVDFLVSDFSKLPFMDNSVDGIFALETFVHSKDSARTLTEFKRVLKPGGRLAIFDYETTSTKEINNKKMAKSVRSIAEGTVAPGFLSNNHGFYYRALTESNFSNIKVQNKTAKVIPMLRLFRKWAALPHFFVRLFGGEARYVNTTIGGVGYRLAQSGLWKFVVVTANKRK